MADEEKKGDGKKEYDVKGSADVTGDAEGRLDVEAKVGWEGGAKGPDPTVEAVRDLKSGIDAAFARFEDATKDAARETTKAAVPTPPRAVASSGRVD